MNATTRGFLLEDSLGPSAPLRYDAHMAPSPAFSPALAAIPRAGRTLAAAAALLLFIVPARADVTHVVGRGHTIEAIAHRYHVTVKSIVDANHLKDTRHLKVGETLIIPGVTAAAAKPGTKGA